MQNVQSEFKDVAVIIYFGALELNLLIKSLMILNLF